MTPKKARPKPRDAAMKSASAHASEEWLARAVITSSGLVADYGTNKQLSLERLVAESGEKAALLGSGTVSRTPTSDPECSGLLARSSEDRRFSSILA